MYATSGICRSAWSTFFGTAQDGLSRSLSFTCGIGSPPEGYEIAGNNPFPQTLRSMQSVLGSLNYYGRFIEDFALYASGIYELREADFHEIRRMDKAESTSWNEKGIKDRNCRGDSDSGRIGVTGGYSKMDDPKGPGDSDPYRICVTRGDPEFPELPGATWPHQTEVDGRKRCFAHHIEGQDF